MTLFKVLTKKFVKDGTSQFQNFCVNPQISCTVLYDIITLKMGYHNFCARWVPKMLTDAHKTQRMTSALTFLERYHKNGDEFFSHIVRVTGDDIWISFVNVETKEQSKQWMHTHSPNKFKQTSTCQKADDKYVLVQERSADGGIHATRDHSNVRSVLRNTKKNLCRAIQNKRHGMLTYGLMLLHGNDRSHTVVRTRTLLENFNWGLFDHPPYILKLAPSDHNLYTQMKNWLRSQRFNNNEELMEGVKTWLSPLTAYFFDTGIQKLIPRYDKCLSYGGDYVEK
jgi:hypothetical protein